MRLARTGASVALAILGVLAAAFGPEVFRWQAAVEHDKRTQIGVLGAIAWLGASYIVVRPKNWQIVLPGVVVAALLAAVTIT